MLDTSGIAISTADSQQKVPAIAFGGADYLVVWEDLRSGLGDDIYGARVTPAGAVLDSGGIVISSAADNQWHPAISFGGTNYLVVWEDSRSVPQWDIYGARVASDRVVLDTLWLHRLAGGKRPVVSCPCL